MNPATLVELVLALLVAGVLLKTLERPRRIRRWSSSAGARGGYLARRRQ
ncbi:MAG: hypothetical protein ACJ76I_11975 [Gaiellaceae bacterium]